MINKSPSILLQGDIPQRVWTGKDMSYRHMKVLGCLACVHIAKDRRGKLDPKRRKCIFLGYGEDEFGYRLSEFIGELGIWEEEFWLHYNNQSVIHLAKKVAYHSRTKHIQRRYHWLRERESRREGFFSSEGSYGWQWIRHANEGATNKEAECVLTRSWTGQALHAGVNGEFVGKNSLRMGRARGELVDLDCHSTLTLDYDKAQMTRLRPLRLWTRS